jgi:hypothetical protein
MTYGNPEMNAEKEVDREALRVPRRSVESSADGRIIRISETSDRSVHGGRIIRESRTCRRRRSLWRKRRGFTAVTRDRSYDFLIIFLPKNSPKKLAFLTQNNAKLCKNLILTLVFEKNANFFAKNCRKSLKIFTFE